MMQTCKVGDCYVRDVKAAPEPISSDQLDDLVQFCGSPVGIESCIMTVDPTFVWVLLSEQEQQCSCITQRWLLLVLCLRPPVCSNNCSRNVCCWCSSAFVACYKEK